MLAAALAAGALHAVAAARHSDLRNAVSSRLTAPRARGMRARALPSPSAWRARSERRAYDRALPELLEAIARHLRGGASLRVSVLDGATAVPSEVALAFGSLADAAASGAPIVEAAQGWARARPDAGTRLAAAALALGATTGGAPARSLDAVAATLRDRLALAGEASASSAQARLSAAVVGGAPLAFAALAAGLDAHSVSFLFTTPLGGACLAGGIGLDALGLWWMRRIVEGVAL